MAVAGSPVGVAAKLPVVGSPGVGGFDDPAPPEPQRLTFDARDLGAAALELELVEAGGTQPVPHGTRVVAAVEVQDTGLGEQAGLVDSIEGGLVIVVASDGDPATSGSTSGPPTPGHNASGRGWARPVWNTGRAHELLA